MVLALVFGVGQVLGSLFPSAPPSARVAAGTPGSATPSVTSSPRSTADPLSPSGAPADSPGADSSPSQATVGPDPTVSAHPSHGGKRNGGSGKGRGAKRPLPEPSGTCRNSDVMIRPAVDGPAYAWQGAVVTLHLSSVTSPACNWEVSERSVVVAITSGSDAIWTTQDCGEAVVPEAVVLRKRTDTEVDVAWSGQRSDDDCTDAAEWARPGWYHVEAAAWGADGIDAQFELTTAPEKPKKQGRKHKSRR